MKISVNVSKLSTSQREFLSTLILSYPSLESDEPLNIPAFSYPDAPEEAFGPALIPPPPVVVVAEDDQPVVVVAEDDHLDKAGLPWDERIHASSRARTADGLWRKKRGVDAAVPQVEAELKTLMAVPAPPAPASNAGDRQGYIKLITVASAAIGSKKLTQDQLNAAVVAAGVPSLPLLGNRLDLVPQVHAAIQMIVDCAA